MIIYSIYKLYTVFVMFICFKCCCCVEFTVSGTYHKICCSQSLCRICGIPLSRRTVALQYHSTIIAVTVRTPM